MAELHVRKLPPDLHEQLRESAEAEGRSMSAQAIVLLRHALQRNSDQTARQRAAIDLLLEIQGRSRLSPNAPSAEQLVREDRDIAG